MIDAFGNQLIIQVSFIKMKHVMYCIQNIIGFFKILIFLHYNSFPVFLI
jgi:hypothetical protein